MLTGKLVRVRYARDRIIPYYLDVTDAALQEMAERLLEMFRRQGERTRGELEEELRDTFGSDPGQLVHQGLVKLLQDRCEFEVMSGHPPERCFVAAAKTFSRSSGGGWPETTSNSQRSSRSFASP